MLSMEKYSIRCKRTRSLLREDQIEEINAAANRYEDAHRHAVDHHVFNLQVVKRSLKAQKRSRHFS